MTSSYPAPRVAVLEDDSAMRDHIIMPGLARYGFEVEGFATIASLTSFLAKEAVDFVVLDLGLPDGNGFTLAKTLRSSHPRLGIVMLTSRSDPADHARGLGDGADAYLTKPVALDLLASVLHSLARRLGVGARTEEGEQVGWRLSHDGWSVTPPGGRAIALTEGERLLCQRLFASPGELVSRDELARALTDDVQNFDTHRIDSMINRLRAKVRSRSNSEFPLKAVHGRGYMITRVA